MAIQGMRRARYLHHNFLPLSIEIRKQNIDTMSAISVDVEISDKLKKAKLETGFYNLIDAHRPAAVMARQ
jgi:hypothetical protein